MAFRIIQSTISGYEKRINHRKPSCMLSLHELAYVSIISLQTPSETTHCPLCFCLSLYLSFLTPILSLTLCLTFALILCLILSLFDSNSLPLSFPLSASLCLSKFLSPSLSHSPTIFRSLSYFLTLPLSHILPL